MADLLFYCSCILESCRCGSFRFPYQSSHCTLLYAGIKHNSGHGHTALFGVYGMLGIGLMLFVLKGLAANKIWKNGVIDLHSGQFIIGLALMVLLSVLPGSFAQTVASVGHGLWYARSAEFLQSPTLCYIQMVKSIWRYNFCSQV